MAISQSRIVFCFLCFFNFKARIHIRVCDGCSIIANRILCTHIISIFNIVTVIIAVAIHHIRLQSIKDTRALAAQFAVLQSECICLVRITHGCKCVCHGKVK